MKYMEYKEEIIKGFFDHSIIKDTPNQTVSQILDFLLEPKSVAAMILMTELGQPALAGVVKELEDKFAESDFPLCIHDEEKNAKNRRNVGWIVRYIMGKFGYTPKEASGSERYLAQYAGSSYFCSAAVYQKTKDAEYELFPFDWGKTEKEIKEK